MTTATNLPTLSGFTTHYGIPVAGIGEEGELVALGHHEPRRAFAAFNRFVRREWGWDLASETKTRSSRTLADRIRHEHFVVGNTCGDCDNQPDCVYCTEARRHDWWLRQANSTDRDTFPVTIWH